MAHCFEFVSLLSSKVVVTSFSTVFHHLHLVKVIITVGCKRNIKSTKGRACLKSMIYLWVDLITPTTFFFALGFLFSTSFSRSTAAQCSSSPSS
ncbi:hypothetical protein IWZ00DRAFT_495531 [Phyllosticta capitalensis]